MSNSNTLAITTTNSPSITILDISTNQTHTLTLKDAQSIADIDWSHNGNILASLHDYSNNTSSSSSDSTSVVSLVHAPTRAVYETFEIANIPGVSMGTSQGCSLGFGNKSRYLLVAERNETEVLGNRIQILDVKKRGGILRKFSCKNGVLRQASFDPTDTYVITMTDEEVGVYKVKEGTLETRLGLGVHMEGQRFCTFQFSPHDSNIIAVGTQCGSVHLWNLKDSGINVALPYYSCQSSHSGAVTSLAFSPVNQVLLSSCGLDGKIQFYDIVKQKEVQGFHVPSAATSMAYHQVDWTKCAVGLDTGEVYLYDLRKLQSPISKKMISNDGSAIKSIHFPRPKPNKNVKHSSEGDLIKKTRPTQRKADTDLSFANRTISFDNKHTNESKQEQSSGGIRSTTIHSSNQSNSITNTSYQRMHVMNRKIDDNSNISSNPNNFKTMKEDCLTHEQKHNSTEVRESPRKGQKVEATDKVHSSITCSSPSKSFSPQHYNPISSSINEKISPTSSRIRHKKEGQQNNDVYSYYNQAKGRSLSSPNDVQESPAHFGGDSLSPISKASEFDTPGSPITKKDASIKEEKVTKNNTSKFGRPTLEAGNLRPTLQLHTQQIPNEPIVPQKQQLSSWDSVKQNDIIKAERSTVVNKVFLFFTCIFCFIILKSYRKDTMTKKKS